MPRSVDTWVNRDHEPTLFGSWSNETREERTEKKVLARKADAKKKQTGISHLRLQKLKGHPNPHSWRTCPGCPLNKFRGKQKGSSKLITRPIDDLTAPQSQEEDNEMS